MGGEGLDGEGGMTMLTVETQREAKGAEAAGRQDICSAEGARACTVNTRPSIARKPHVVASTFSVLCRLIVGCVFIFAGMSKIQSPLTFLEAVHDYRLVGQKLELLAAVAVPWV